MEDNSMINVQASKLYLSYKGNSGVREKKKITSLFFFPLVSVTQMYAFVFTVSLILNFSVYI